MQTRLNSYLWRIFSFLLIFTLVLTPSGSYYSQAPADSHETQDQEPEFVAAPGDHLVTNIILGPDTPNILGHGQQVYLDFSYSTNQEGGVRIFARPFTDGALTPGFSAHPSGTYPTSATGVGEGWFTINSGQVVVDQIRIRMTDANQTTILFETFIPVHYLFSNPENIVTGINLNPDTPDVLSLGQNLNLDFEYNTNQQGGVRIFARPFTNGALTPNYGAHGSTIYPYGNGKGSGFFSISSGQVVVDQIRIQMWNANQTTLLFEAFLPVYYRFWTPTNIVTNIELSPDTPNVFKYNENVNLTFLYNTNQEGGVRIFLRPFSGANLSPNYGAHPSELYLSGSGRGTGWFNLGSGPTVVDKIRVRMVDEQSNLLFEAFLPVHLLWAGAGPPPGPDMSITAIEVTQAIQDLNNSVDLVAGKPTYVRVHTSSPSNVSNVFATLSGRRGLVSLTPVINPGNPGAAITVRTSPDRGQINDSHWFLLPSSWTTAGNLRLTARLDPNNAKNDLNQTNNSISVMVNFKDTPPLRLRLVNVQYTTGGTTYLAGNNHLNAVESWLGRAYPISSLQVTRQTFVYPSSGLPNVDTLHSWLALGKLLRVIFTGEDARTVYYGLVDDGGGFMRGKAAGIPGTIAAGPTGTDTWGWDFDGSYGDWYTGHEIGHTRGRYHAMFCGAGGGTSYPYPNGRISPDLTGNGAIYGFDIVTRAIYGPNWKDVMTYCSNQWVSDFTYEGIRDYMVGIGSVSTASTTMVTASDFLVVMGLAHLATNTASLESVYLISQDNTLPLPEPGDWTIALVDAANNDLATHPFAPDELTDAEESPGVPAVIAEIVPWSPGAVKVEIRYDGEMVASRSASANPPSVNLIAPADGSDLPDGSFQVSWAGSDVDGDTLTYSLLYSNDGGLDWQTLATGVSGSGTELNTDQLPGGVGALRVVVSDGFYSDYDTNSGLIVPLHPPSAEILLPNADQVFHPTQQVDLVGSAYDLEDGVPDDEAFTWLSDVDGSLGNGANLSTSMLSTGAHVITLQVTDTDGMSGQAQRAILVAEEDVPVVLNLDVAPFGIGEVIDFGGAAVQHAVTLRSTGASELNWTASENIPWLSLNITAGQTPSDLILTINPGNLRVGSYNGQITFSSTQAENSPLSLAITLQVIGRVLYMPSISRQ
jgi:hypothetical protein